MDGLRPYGKMRGVIGGFHGFDRLEALEGLELIAPTHCTQQTEAIADRYPKAFRQVAAGTDWTL